MSSKPLVTIAVFNYNGIDHLHDCLTSLQIDKLDSSVEIILLDDASTDGSAEVMREFGISAINKNVILKLNRHNSGTVSQVKDALKIAKGAYFKPIATDDLLDIGNLKRELMNFNANSWDILLSRCAIIEKEPTNSYLAKLRYMRHFCRLPNWLKLLCLGAGNNLIAVGAVYKTSSYRTISKYIDTTLIEDWPTWIVATYHGYNFTYSDEIHTHYRIHDKQVTKSVKLMDTLNSDICKIRKLFKSYNYYFLAKTIGSIMNRIIIK